MSETHAFLAVLHKLVQGGMDGAVGASPSYNQQFTGIGPIDLLIGQLAGYTLYFFRRAAVSYARG